MKLSTKLLATALIVLPATTSADYNFIPKLGLTNKTYSLDMGQGFPTDKDTITATVTGLSWGFTVVSSSKWYLDFEQFGGTGTHTGLTADSGDYVRSDGSLSIGRSFDGGFTAFTGVRFGSSEFIYDNGTDDDADILNDNVGIFIGGAKSFVLTPNSNFSLSIAIASLTGEFKSFHSETDIDATGDTLGFSLGAAWNKRIAKKWNLSLGGRYQSFTYNDVKDAQTVIGDQSETITSIYAKMGYIF